jgi:hypothetical protein
MSATLTMTAGALVRRQVRGYLETVRDVHGWDVRWSESGGLLESTFTLADTRDARIAVADMARQAAGR